jgi:hypothetical protein
MESSSIGVIIFKFVFREIEDFPVAYGSLSPMALCRSISLLEGFLCSRVCSGRLRRFLVGLWRTDRHVNPLVVASLTSVSPWMPHTVYIGGGEEPKYLRAWPELLGVVLALIPHHYIGYGRTCPGEGSPIKETTDPNLPQIIARTQSQPKMAGFRSEEEIKGQESRDFPFVWRISKSYLALLYLQMLAYLFPILLSLLRNFKTATTIIMERISTEDMVLVNRFEALAVRSRPRQAIQLGENEISEKNWGYCLVFIVVTTRTVVFMHLKEALHKG